MTTINTKKILVPIDFSITSTRAIKHAATIAKLTNGELIFLHVQKKHELLDIILPVFQSNSTTKIERFLYYKLEELAQKARDEYRINIKTIILIGNITTEIIKAADENEVGLIVMGTQGKDSSNEGLFLGSNSYRVLTKSPIPVMTIRSDTPNSGYSNILLPIDSSFHSRQKVNAAMEIAQTFSSKLHILGLLGSHEDVYEYKLNVILPQIRKLAEIRKLSCTAEIEKAINRAEKTIAYAKEVKADLIIIMSDQSSELSSFILGSYAHQLINNSKIPVLTIPPEIHPEMMAVDSIGGMW